MWKVPNAEQIGGGEKSLEQMQSSNGSVSTEIKPVTSAQKPQRRRFTATEKLRIVREADALQVGKIGAFLRREGIYSSQLYAWRKQRDDGDLDPSAVRQRATAKLQADKAAQRIKQLERETQKLRRQLARAELINDIQKNLRGSWGSTWRAPRRTRTQNECGTGPCP